MPKKKLFSITAAVLAGGLATLTLSPQTAQAFDVDPGDYEAAPPGTSLAIGYALFGWNNRFRDSHGDQVSNSSANSQVGILRLVHYFDIGITIDPQIFIPFGAINNGKLGGTNLDSSFGLGDIIIASTFWFVNQPEERRWLGFTPFIFFPTGQYRSGQTLNIGANRFAEVLQLGFVQGFLDKWTVDLIADTTFYQDNDDAGPDGNDTFSQDNSYQVQAWLRYKVTPNWQVGGGWSGTWGGNTELAGEDFVLASHAQQLRLITQYWPLPDLQLQASVTTDVWVEGGYQEVFGLNLKLMKVF